MNEALGVVKQLYLINHGHEAYCFSPEKAAWKDWFLNMLCIISIQHNRF